MNGCVEVLQGIPITLAPGEFFSLPDQGPKISAPLPPEYFRPHPDSTPQW
jgi:hypothetical protein